MENVFSPPKGDLLLVCKAKGSHVLKNSVFLVTTILFV